MWLRLFIRELEIDDFDLFDAQVQTDDQAGTQGGNREKDPRSLSGGEKSFSTICLLLSLWESIGCPIRCLGKCCSGCQALVRGADGCACRRVRRVHGRGQQTYQHAYDGAWRHSYWTGSGVIDDGGWTD